MTEHAFLPLTPEDVRRLMADFPHAWWIAGGWAIDLFLGHQTREHADMDVAILRGAEPALRTHFSNWDIEVAHDGALEDWDGAVLQPPRDQFFARPTSDRPWLWSSC